MPTTKKNPGKKTKASPTNGIDLNAALQEYFGFKDFKGQQKKSLNPCWQVRIPL